MNMPQLKFSMPGLIVLVLLLYFGLALFGTSIGIKVADESPLIQTLINLTIAGCAFYIGTTQGSAKKDDVIAGMSPTPPTTTTPPKDPAS